MLFSMLRWRLPGGENPSLLRGCHPQKQGRLHGLLRIVRVSVNGGVAAAAESSLSDG